MKVKLKHKRLASEIARSGLTQNRWAIRLGISSGQLSELVNGKRPYPPPATREKLLAGLKLCFRDLFELEGPQHQQPSPEHSPKTESSARPPERRVLLDWTKGRYRLRLDRREQASRQASKGRIAMHGYLSDLRFCLRGLRRSPLFTTVAVLTLALGIGANAAIFSIVDASLIRSLPFPQPEELVYLSIAANGQDGAALALVDWEAIQASRSGIFEDSALYSPGSVTWQGPEGPRAVQAAQVTPNFFRLLGVTPQAGSGLVTAGTGVVVSHSFAQRLSTDHLSGLGLKLDERDYPIVGVLPAGFRFPGLAQADLWLALDTRPSGSRGPFQYRAVARVDEGVTGQEAQNRLHTVSKALRERYSDNGHWSYSLAGLQERFVVRTRSTLLLLLTAVAIVLLVATLNVANLAVTRALNRAHETAVRTLMGAGRLRLISRFLTEGVLLALAGGLLGCLLASWGVQLLASSSISRLATINPISVDTRTLLFGLAVSLVCGVLFSAAPALQLMRRNLASGVRSSGRAGLGRGQSRMGSILVAAEFAVALALLVGAGLLTRSLSLLMDEYPGFRSQNVLSVNLVLPHSRYARSAERAAFFERLEERVGALPGVAGVGLASGRPPDRPNASNDFLIEGQPLGPAERPPIELLIFADNGYFQAAGIPLKKGRLFTSPNSPQGPPEALIDEALAARYFPGQDPLGKRLRIGSNSTNPWAEIRGVVGAVKYLGLQAGFQPAIYISTQEYAAADMYLLVRSDQPPEPLAESLRQAVAELDPALALTSVETLEQTVRESASLPRLRTSVMGAFSAAALLLAALGIYAAISFGVDRRRRETGIRMALGAAPKDVLRLMLAAGLKPALMGWLIGLAASAGLSRLLTGMLYGVQPLDGETFGLASAVVLSVALSACLAPALRAARLDPVSSLRCD